MKELKELLKKYLENTNLEEVKFFNFQKAWPDIVIKILGTNEGHIFIKNLKNNILIIETDHCGWIQLLQTKQEELLKIIKTDYKLENINSISVVLKK
ncbi:MAG: hypothetical protein Ta2F_17000 [Termitinemataceae bacterium]|nr:MAG: hypothetical protein Ta2F_17000 [Termitinemataceae bacterium]